MEISYEISDIISRNSNGGSDIEVDIHRHISLNSPRVPTRPSSIASRLSTEWLRHLIIGAICCSLVPAISNGDVQSISQTLAANVAAFGKVSVPAATTLRSASSRFESNLSGTLAINYWARTSDSGGGSISVQAGSEFSPAGGPSVSAVTYSCSGATLGSSCSGVQTLTTSSQTPVVSLPANACTGGGGACSTQDPNTVLLTISAPDKPRYRTGTYSAVITFTISTI